MDYKVNLVFPCDFEEKNKKHSKRFTKKYCRDEIKEYRYLSPIFSVNQGLDKSEKEKKEQIKDESTVVSEIFTSCNILVNKKDKDNSVNDEDEERVVGIFQKFTVSNMFFPYGICLCAVLNIDEINEVITIIQTNFKPTYRRNAKEKRDDPLNDNPEWIIVERPFVIVEPCQEIDISSMGIKSKIKVLDLSYSKIKLSVSNDIIIVQSLQKATKYELESVLAVLLALKKLSSNVRLTSKHIAPQFGLSNKEKQELVTDIHLDCAVFDEIDNKNIFFTDLEQELFEKLRKPLCVDAQKRQIRSARENVDFIHNESVGNKTEKINDTLFITGYIGLILSFLAFTPIELRDIMWIAQPLGPQEKIYSCVTLILMIVLSIMLLRKIYSFVDFLIEKYTKPKMVWLKVLATILSAGLIIYLFFASFINGYLRLV